MSQAIIRTATTRLLISLALAVAALIFTSLVAARPDRVITPTPSTVRFDVPAGAPWCAPTDGTHSCRYLTFESCLKAEPADYRACKPNPAAVAVPDDTHYWTYQSVFL